MCEYTVTDKTLNEIQQDLRAELAAYRYQIETQGIEVGGARIKTDRESQATVGNAYTSLKNGLIPSTQWKAENGWSSVTLAELEPIAQAVSRHVSSCFGAERAVDLMIDELTVETAELFDIYSEFDQQLAAI